jgi:calcineurin-like phosphoesterase family protein
MKEIFLTADLHLGHEKTACVFTREDGTKLRPFESAEHQDEVLVQNWNAVVKTTDKVYVLGDVAMKAKDLKTMLRLNGDKVLVAGNHDIFGAKELLKYFRDVRAYHVMDKILFSHIPVHADSIGRFRANIHGHLHERVVLLPCGKPDPRYLCVSVEQTGFTPVNYSEVLETVKHSEQYVLDYNLESNFKPKGNHAA